MIEIKISGMKDRELREELRSYAHFCIKELLPRKRRLLIQIRLTDSLLENDGMLGSCMPEDWPINRRHYEFEICLDSKMDYETMISILGHELAHVSQYSTGKLLYDYRNPDITIWNGIRYPDNAFPYEKQPWEIDAVEKEIYLREKWLV